MTGDGHLRPAGANRWARWLWAVPAGCLLGSASVFAWAWLAALSFEPTDDAQFTAYVYRPYVRAGSIGFAISLVALAAVLVLARTRARTRGSVALSATALLLVVALVLQAEQASLRRRHPDARLLSALAAAPLGEGWVLQDGPAVRRDGPTIGSELAAPVATEQLRTATDDRTAVCAQLVALLQPQGWRTQQPGSCSLYRAARGVTVFALVDLQLRPGVETVTYQAVVDTSR